MGGHASAPESLGLGDGADERQQSPRHWHVVGSSGIGARLPSLETWGLSVGSIWEEEVKDNKEHSPDRRKVSFF